MTSLSGSCLCGGVRFEADLPADLFQYCHCSSCRKSSGSAHAANLMFPLTALRWTRGEDLIGRFTDEHANPGYGRWFCTTCGSPIPRLSRTRKFWVVPAGTLDSAPRIEPQRNIYWDDRASWFVNCEALPKLAAEIGSEARDDPHRDVDEMNRQI